MLAISYPFPLHSPPNTEAYQIPVKPRGPRAMNEPLPTLDAPLQAHIAEGGVHLTPGSLRRVNPPWGVGE